MDDRGNIYERDPDKIPAEDKARLEGFLKGRAEADAAKARAEYLEDREALIAKIHQLEAESKR